MGQNSSKRRSYTPGISKNTEIASEPVDNGDFPSGSIKVHTRHNFSSSDVEELNTSGATTSLTSKSSSTPKGNKSKRKRLKVSFPLKKTPSGRWSRKKRLSQNGVRARQKQHQEDGAVKEMTELGQSETSLEVKGNLKTQAKPTRLMKHNESERSSSKRKSKGKHNKKKDKDKITNIIDDKDDDNEDVVDAAKALPASVESFEQFKLTAPGHNSTLKGTTNEDNVKDKAVGRKSTSLTHFQELVKDIETTSTSPTTEAVSTLSHQHLKADVYRKPYSHHADNSPYTTFDATTLTTDISPTFVGAETENILNNETATETESDLADEINKEILNRAHKIFPDSSLNPDIELKTESSSVSENNKDPTLLSSEETNGTSMFDVVSFYELEPTNFSLNISENQNSEMSLFKNEETKIDTNDDASSNQYDDNIETSDTFLLNIIVSEIEMIPKISDDEFEDLSKNMSASNNTYFVLPKHIEANTATADSVLQNLSEKLETSTVKLQTSDVGTEIVRLPNSVETEKPYHSSVVEKEQLLFPNDESAEIFIPPHDFIEEMPFLSNDVNTEISLPNYDNREMSILSNDIYNTDMLTFPSNRTTETAIVQNHVNTEMSILPDEVKTEMSIISDDVNTEMSTLPNDFNTETSILPNDVSIEMSILPNDINTELFTLPYDGSTEMPAVPNDVNTEMSILQNDVSRELFILPDDIITEVPVIPNDVSTKMFILPDDVITEMSIVPNDVSTETSKHSKNDSTEMTIAPNDVITEMYIVSNDASTEMTILPNDVCTEMSIFLDDVSTEWSISPIHVITEMPIVPHDGSTEMPIHSNDASTNLSLLPNKVITEMLILPDDVSMEIPTVSNDVISEMSICQNEARAEIYIPHNDINTEVSIPPNDVSTEVSIPPNDVSTEVSIRQNGVSTETSLFISDMSTQLSALPNDNSTELPTLSSNAGTKMAVLSQNNVPTEITIHRASLNQPVHADLNKIETNVVTSYYFNKCTLKQENQKEEPHSDKLVDNNLHCDENRNLSAAHFHLKNNATYQMDELIPSERSGVQDDAHYEEMNLCKKEQQLPNIIHAMLVVPSPNAVDGKSDYETLEITGKPDKEMKDNSEIQLESDEEYFLQNTNLQLNSTDEEMDEKNIGEDKARDLETKASKKEKEKKRNKTQKLEKSKSEKLMKIPKKISSWFHKKDKESFDINAEVVSEELVHEELTKFPNEIEQTAKSTLGLDENPIGECKIESSVTSEKYDPTFEAVESPLSDVTSTESSPKPHCSVITSSLESPKTPTFNVHATTPPSSNNGKSEGSGFLKKISIGSRLRTAILRKKSIDTPESSSEAKRVFLTQPKTIKISDSTIAQQEVKILHCSTNDDIVPEIQIPIHAYPQLFTVENTQLSLNKSIQLITDENIQISTDENIQLYTDENIELSTNKSIQLNADENIQLSSNEMIQLCTDKNVQLSTNKSIQLNADKNIQLSTDKNIQLSIDENIQLSPDECSKSTFYSILRPQMINSSEPVIKFTTKNQDSVDKVNELEPNFNNRDITASQIFVKTEAQPNNQFKNSTTWHEESAGRVRLSDPPLFMADTEIMAGDITIVQLDSEFDKNNTLILTQKNKYNEQIVTACNENMQYQLDIDNKTLIESELEAINREATTDLQPHVEAINGFCTTELSSKVTESIDTDYATTEIQRIDHINNDGTTYKKSINNTLIAQSSPDLLNSVDSTLSKQHELVLEKNDDIGNPVEVCYKFDPTKSKSIDENILQSMDPELFCASNARGDKTLFVSQLNAPLSFINNTKDSNTTPLLNSQVNDLVPSDNKQNTLKKTSDTDVSHNQNLKISTNNFDIRFDAQPTEINIERNQYLSARTIAEYPIGIISDIVGDYRENMDFTESQTGYNDNTQPHNENLGNFDIHHSKEAAIDPFLNKSEETEKHDSGNNLLPIVDLTNGKNAVENPSSNTYKDALTSNQNTSQTFNNENNNHFKTEDTAIYKTNTINEDLCKCVPNLELCFDNNFIYESNGNTSNNGILSGISEDLKQIKTDGHNISTVKETDEIFSSNCGGKEHCLFKENHNNACQKNMDDTTFSTTNFNNNNIDDTEHSLQQQHHQKTHSTNAISQNNIVDNNSTRIEQNQ